MLRVHCAVSRGTDPHPTTTPRRGQWTTRGRRGPSTPQRYGDHSERETPGPIPNPEAKPLSADGTARATAWESRTSPDTNHDQGSFGTPERPLAHLILKRRPLSVERGSHARAYEPGFVTLAGSVAGGGCPGSGCGARLRTVGTRRPRRGWTASAFRWQADSSPANGPKRTLGWALGECAKE